MLLSSRFGELAQSVHADLQPGLVLSLCILIAPLLFVPNSGNDAVAPIRRWRHLFPAGGEFLQRVSWFHEVLQCDVLSMVSIEDDRNSSAQVVESRRALDSCRLSIVQLNNEL